MTLAQKIELLVSELTILLIRQNATLLSAESCTGGWLAKYCTDIAGSSAWYEGGVVSYSDRLKQNLLNVPAETLKKAGAVSEATAQDMALGACHLVEGKKTRVGVAITGIAGPGGGSEEKPVGTVCFGWARQVPERVSQVLGVDTQLFEGTRDEIRQHSVHYALKGLLERLAPLS